MKTGPKYRKPPVIEALCELFFVDSAWDDTIPGRFYEGIKDRFPERRQQETQEAQVAFSPSGEAMAGVRRLAPRIQFLSMDQNRLIQLERDLLVVNQLPPYPHFEDWEPAIREALDSYCGLAAPKGVKRLGVQYINRIAIPQMPVTMEDYFTVYPRLPSTMGNVHGGFMVRFEIADRTSGHSVLVTFATAPSDKPGELAQLLDLHDIFQPAEPFRVEDVMSQVLAAHDNLQAAFEGSITDKLRQLFEPEN